MLALRSATVLPAIGLVVLLGSAAAGAAPAARLVVNSTADTDDGACTPDVGGCTLREAILAVNAAPPRAIAFEPEVFPRVAPGTIALTAALPKITVSGVEIDGDGAAVVISGNAAGPADGLAFESAAGTPLAGIRVAHLRLAELQGSGLRICAGGPACDAPLFNVRVQNVVAFDADAAGVAIEGGTAAKILVEGSFAVASGTDGFRVRSTSGDLVAVTIRSSTAVDSAGSDFAVTAEDELAGARLFANVSTGGDAGGFTVAGHGGVLRTQIVGNRAFANVGRGFFVSSETRLSGVRIERNTALASAEQGFSVAGGSRDGRIRIAGNTALLNGQNGIVLSGAAALVVGNRCDGNTLAGIFLSSDTARSRVTRNVAMANGTFGIALPGGEPGIRVDRNVALGNTSFDLDDDQLACSAHAWVANVSQTASPLCAASPPPPPATDLVVNSTADTDDGSCEEGAGGCTLREAILAVNAGPARSIGFDPAVFVPGEPGTITLGAALPVIEPSGVAVDATGASVLLSGGAAAIDGLVFGSPAGTPLSGVRVVNLSFLDFGGDGLVVCAGYPACDAPLEGVAVRHVVARASHVIRIRGATVTDALVARSLAVTGGFEVRAATDGTNLAVTGSTSHVFEGPGILVGAGGTLAGARLIDNVANQTEGMLTDAVGLEDAEVLGNRAVLSANAGLFAGGTFPASVARFEGNEAYGSGGDGLAVIAAGRVAANTAVANNGRGLLATGPGLLVQGNRTDRNSQSGLLLGGESNGSRLRRNVALGNGQAGIRVSAVQAGNRAERNLAVGSTFDDLADDNAGCAGTTWLRNVFLSSDPDCIR
jgi:CSLREA domain-containing protein